MSAARATLGLAVLVAAAACAQPVDDLGPQLMVITVDAEALPHRQSERHVERLIWGDFGADGRAGIDEMMDAADAAGVEISIFLDVVEETYYPGEISAVARHIVERGHDLELHTHPEAAPDSFWASMGVDRKSTDQFTRDEGVALLGACEAMMASWGVPPPVAYRAGAYRYSRGLVEALPDLGIGESYNYNPLGHSQDDLDLGYLPVFTWENGTVEVPISYVSAFGEGGGARFDSDLVADSPVIADMAIAFFRQRWRARNVLVLMMHSWSFLGTEDVDGETYFTYEDDHKRAAFEAFLTSLPDQVRVVSARELADLIAAGELPVDHEESTADIFDQ